MCWVQGYYVKQAIESSVFVAGLADRKVISKMPSYPKMPYINETIQTSEEEKLKEIERKMEKWVKINNRK